MAGLLLWGVLALPFGGCLVPQDDQVLPELPPKKNTPPRIVRESVQPPYREVTVNAGAACRPVFSVAAEDVDYDAEKAVFSDRLRARWFIDPNGVYTSTPGSIVREDAVPIGTTLTRLVTAHPQFIAALAGLTDGQKHRVEVWVTDGEFEEFSDPPPGGLRVRGQEVPMPDGTLMENPAYYDSYEWLVTVEAGCP